MKDRIERELARIETEAFNILRQDGVGREEAVSIAHTALSKMLADEDDPERKRLGAFFGVLVGVGMARAALEDEPGNPEVIDLFSVASEMFGAALGIRLMKRATLDSTASQRMEEAIEQAQRDAISALASRAAGARHTENREIAARIRAWYADNHHRYRSMDKAAEAVMRIEPVSFKTARKHVGAAAKNLPSARKE